MNYCGHFVKELDVEELAVEAEAVEEEEEGAEDGEECAEEMCYLWQMETRQEQARILCECVVVVWALLYILKVKKEIHAVWWISIRIRSDTNFWSESDP